MTSLALPRDSVFEHPVSSGQLGKARKGLEMTVSALLKAVLQPLRRFAIALYIQKHHGQKRYYLTSPQRAAPATRRTAPARPPHGESTPSRTFEGSANT